MDPVSENETIAFRAIHHKEKSRELSLMQNPESIEIVIANPVIERQQARPIGQRLCFLQSHAHIQPRDKGIIPGQFIQLRLECFHWHSSNSGPRLRCIARIADVVIHHDRQVEWLVHVLIRKSTRVRWLRSDNSCTSCEGIESCLHWAVTSCHCLSKVNASMRRDCPFNHCSFSEKPVLV